MSLSDVAKMIVKLRWDKNFDKALETYKNEVHKQFTVQEIASQPKMMGAIIDCLKETGKSKEAISMIEEYWKIRASNINNASLIKNIAWTYYFAFKPGKPPMVSHHHSRTAFITELLLHLHKMEETSLFGMLFFSYCEYLDEHNSELHSNIEELINTFGPGNFSDHCKSIAIVVKGQKKENELASDQEKWHVLKTKTLFALQRYDECIAACKTALEHIQRFHHGNQHWIARRLSLSYKQTGDFDKAIHELEKLTQKRREWFIEKELAELYYQKSDFNQALTKCISACLNQGYSEYKTTLFQLTGDVLLALDKASDACNTYWLAFIIRQEQAWKIPESLKATILNCKQKPEKSARELYNQVSLKWKTHKKDEEHSKNSLAGSFYGNGTITRILNSGSNGDGFITDADGHGIYFRFGNCRIKPEIICEGLEVSFSARQIERKGQKVWNAIKVFLKE